MRALCVLLNSKFLFYFRTLSVEREFLYQRTMQYHGKPLRNKKTNIFSLVFVFFYFAFFRSFCVCLILFLFLLFICTLFTTQHRFFCLIFAPFVVAVVVVLRLFAEFNKNEKTHWILSVGVFFSTIFTVNRYNQLRSMAVMGTACLWIFSQLLLLLDSFDLFVRARLSHFHFSVTCVTLSNMSIAM